ncbi:hypothetical protein ACFY4C_16775 [Actinomadura viridis]|uniref:hypothetical protein n=1 Tax=Actinomadura viridis TaxID=58110 RepID=UPI0036C0BB8B
MAILASATAMAASGIAVTAPSAYAHSESELPGICGSSSYFIVSDGGGVGGKAKRPVTTPSGARWGYVYLLYSNSTGKNCVVTLKTTYHGTPSLTVAELRVENGDRPVDKGDYTHYADVQGNAAGRCVSYRGIIWDPKNTVMASGGRSSWGNCG